MSQTEPLPTFTTTQISSALNIPVPTFQGWQRQGVLDLLESEPTPKGSPRRFTVKDVFQIGIIRQLIENNVRVRHAAIAARATIDAFDEFHGDQVQHVALSFYGDEPEPTVRIYGPDTMEPLPADATITVVVNLLPLFAHVKARFAAAKPEPTVRSTSEVRELVL